jgi:hypothetical protein
MIHFNQGIVVWKALIFLIIAINRGAGLVLVLLPVSHSNHNGFCLLVDVSFDLMRHIFTENLLYQQLWQA